MVHPASNEEEMYVDIGVYGVPKALDFHPKDSTRKIEDYVKRVHGYKVLRRLTTRKISDLLKGFKCCTLTLT